VFRYVLGLSLGSRVPSLANLPPAFDPNAGAVVPQFEENIPLRDQPPLVDTVPGAEPIQEVIDHTAWVGANTPLAYAPHIRKSPLRGMEAKPVIIQFAKTGQTGPNPTTSALVRAGELADRATYLRYDLLYNGGSVKDPHLFLTYVPGSPAPGAAVDAAALGVQAVEAQHQIGIFFATDGAVTIDPDGSAPIFETPIAGPLPEALNYIQ
jgi:hypothetical protein